MLRAALFVAWKDLRILRRDPVGLFWTFLFPVAFALFFGAFWDAATNRHDAVPELLVVDQAHNEVSHRLLEGLVRAKALQLTAARSEQDASRRARRGQAVGYVLLPRGLGDAPSPGAPAMGAKLFFDPTQHEDAERARATLTTALLTQLRAPGCAPEVEVQTAPLARSVMQSTSALELAFPIALLWAVMGCAASFAFGLVTERRRGTLTRLAAAPVHRFSILLGKSLACYSACLLTASLLVVVAVLGFKVRVGSATGLALCLLSVSWCFAAITSFLGALGRSEQGVAAAGWLTLLAMTFFGGALVPLTAMPQWIVTVSDASPIKWAIFALEGAIWRGLTPHEVLAPCAVLLGVGLVGFALGADRLSKLED